MPGTIPDGGNTLVSRSDEDFSLHEIYTLVKGIYLNTYTHTHTHTHTHTQVQQRTKSRKKGEEYLVQCISHFTSGAQGRPYKDDDIWTETRRCWANKPGRSFWGKNIPFRGHNKGEGPETRARSTELKAPWCLSVGKYKRIKSYVCSQTTIELKVGGEGNHRGWDDWMVSRTQWIWVSVNSGSWWWTGRPGVLQSMGSQRVGHNWATELNWW